MIITDCEPLLVGAAAVFRDDESITPIRLPLWTRAHYSNRTMEMVALCPMGVRLRFTTEARRLTLHSRVEQNTSWQQPEPTRAAIWLATTGDGPSRQELARVVTLAPDVLVDEADGSRTLHPRDGGPQTFDLQDIGTSGPRTVELWLPHNARVDLESLESDAPVTQAAPPSGPRWLHYGSSISQCVEADDPLSSWPMQAAAELGADLISVALSGNAMLDPFVARSIADIPADVITLKLGINIVNAAAMTARTFGPAIHGFLDTVRQGHPHTPIVVFTAIACPMHEETPGPTVWGAGRLHGTTSTPPREDELTLEDTRRIVRSVVATREQSDPRLFLAEGTELLGQDDADRLYDDLHPDQAGFDLMAGRLVALVRSREDLARAFGQEFRRST
ncbi:GDSL-type esterase/lipase family protein [Plantibacter sp. YIM 135249]|uniref:GDSL-type esterase/lipase family protein n=1 Tax=Plantibacter sp. YIM 135249 TaxID=3423918 RepID=UPI003D3499AC